MEVSGHSSSVLRRIAKAAKSLFEPVEFLLEHGGFILKLTSQSSRQAMSGSLLGGVWVFLQPMLTFAAYIILFTVLLRVSIAGLEEGQFVAYILTGLASAIAMTLAITSGASSLVSNAHLLKGTLVAPQVIPIKEALAALPAILAGLVLVLAFGVYYGFLGYYAFGVPVFLFFFVMLVVGLGWLLSPVCLVLRDLVHIIPAVLTPFMLISPLAYTIEKAPEHLAPFLYVNPYTYVVVIPQQLLVMNKLPDAGLAIPFIAVSVICYFFGYFSFRRATYILFDNV